MKTLRLHLLSAALLLLVAVSPLRAQHADAIPRDQLIEPAALHQELERHGGQAPLILQVGSRMLFDQAHIPGAEYAGPASQPAGLAALRARVESLPRNRWIVVYCGCCPWERCPNIEPAWRLLHSMGFTHVRALHITNNFGAAWVAAGYGVEK